MRSTRLGAVAVLTTCAVMGFARPVLADPNGSSQTPSQTQNVRPARWEKQFEQFSKTLNLSVDQQQKIKPIFADQAEQLKAVGSDKSLSQQDKQQKVQAIHAATEEQIEPLLIPDQMEKWGEWKQKTWDRTAGRRERASNGDNNQGQWRTHRRGNQEATWQTRFERFNKAVNLTDEQQEKIKPIFQNAAQQLVTLRDDKSMSTEDRQEKARQIRKAFRDQVQPLLTPDQLGKWGAFQEETRGQNEDRREWRMQHRGSREMTWQARFEQFSKTLNLTDDQQAKVKPIFEDQAGQIQAVVSDKSLSEQNKQDKVKTIHTATEEKIEPLLTPDQMEKWGEWKQKGWDRAEEQREQKTEQPEQKTDEKTEQPQDSDQKTDGDNK
jgi:Spy/CpxP family protein refolding chaperone